MKFATLFSIATTGASVFAKSSGPDFMPGSKQSPKGPSSNAESESIELDDCNYETEETCYNEDWNPIACVAYEDGGCPCPEGQEKCGAEGNYTGYCTETCCGEDEETCYDDVTWEAYCIPAVEGCPCGEGQIKCEQTEDYAGYCDYACCDYSVEEFCWGDNTTAPSCAVIADGGCPCLGEGEVKCGGSEYWSGWCTTLCCEDNAETCFNDMGQPESCALISDGGCDCGEGYKKCGATGDYPGYCIPDADPCCDEETCYDSDWNAVGCASYADGGCPCADPEQEKCVTDYYSYCASVCCDPTTHFTCHDPVTWEAVLCAPNEEGCPSDLVHSGELVAEIGADSMKPKAFALHAINLQAKKAAAVKGPNTKNSSIARIAKAKEDGFFRAMKEMF